MKLSDILSTRKDGEILKQLLVLRADIKRPRRRILIRGQIIGRNMTKTLSGSPRYNYILGHCSFGISLLALRVDNIDSRSGLRAMLTEHNLPLLLNLEPTRAFIQGLWTLSQASSLYLV